MSRFFYNYQTIVRFSQPVRNHAFLLRCMPQENACQRSVKQDLFISPAVCVRHDRDVWGNGIQYGCLLDAHDSFVFVSCGEVELSPYRIPDADAGALFRVPTALTEISAPMRAFAAERGGSGAARDVACRLSQELSAYMEYRPGSTGIATTAADAFAQRAGVCQDYAHILIALCRCRGVAARYVDGFIDGVGETHAWAEVYDDGAWWGIDPTHDRWVTDGYIKVGHGRDAADCPVSRGVFAGCSGQQTEIRIIVERLV